MHSTCAFSKEIINHQFQMPFRNSYKVPIGTLKIEFGCRCRTAEIETEKVKHIHPLFATVCLSVLPKLRVMLIRFLLLIIRKCAKWPFTNQFPLFLVCANMPHTHSQTQRFSSLVRFFPRCQNEKLATLITSL